jgi:type III secretion control protein HpaP
MSDEELRRIRRVIEGTPPAAPRPPAVDTRQAERFQRALGPVRRSEPESRNDARRDPDLLSDSPPSAAGSSSAPPSRAAAGTERRPLLPVLATSPVAAALDEPEESTPTSELPDPTWRPAAVAWIPPAPGWDATLVNTIATLCRRADPSLQGFSVTVPLNTEVLPHSELRLTLSQHYLMLRFRTQSTCSHDLVSRHLDSLRTMLAEALPDSRHIDIELT